MKRYTLTRVKRIVLYKQPDKINIFTDISTNFTIHAISARRHTHNPLSQECTVICVKRCMNEKNLASSVQNGREHVALSLIHI